MINELIPHMHAECIKAWADGKQIQWFDYSHKGEWKDHMFDPTWAIDTLYRIKPETLKYRVALIKIGSISYTASVNDKHTSAAIEGNPGFMRWLTDWQEVEVKS